MMKNGSIGLKQKYAIATARLKREIAQRKYTVKALQRSERYHRECLEQSRQMQDQLRLLSRQLLSAQEEERKKISRELHDVIAQTLTGINVQLSALKKETIGNSQGLGQSITRTQRFVEQSVEIVHRFARELRPAVLDDLGLIPALHTFMKGFREQTGIRVTLAAFAAVEQVGSDERTVLFRVAQEALNNVGRHAQATEAKVGIQKGEGVICMTIQDDGKGFQMPSLAQGKRSIRLGLLGMRERVEMVGGSIRLISAPGQGTTVEARIPFATAAKPGANGRRNAKK